MAEEYTKNQLAYRRAKGVNKAWDRERSLVQQGRGTRQWSVAEQKEILKTGRCKGYQGHHMASVKNHLEQADNPKNIQFLSSKKENNEHLKAHKGDYSNQSEWRYNPKSNTYRAIDPKNPRAQYSYELQDKAIEKRGYTKYAAQKQPGKDKTPAQQYAAKGQTQTAGKGSSPAAKHASQDKKKNYQRSCESTSRGQKRSEAKSQSQSQKSSQRR